MHTRYLDDFQVGDTFETRRVSLTEAQIIDFATMYDPQPIHIDLDTAKHGPFGGVIASGFQTLALSFRLFVELGFFVKSNIGGAGMDAIRWTLPVRPGDTLKSIVEVLEVKPSSSKPDRGALRLGVTVVNQRDETVMTYETTAVLRRRPA
jgi:acyl dehydratase